MKDPWSPAKEELRSWAFDANSLWPEQDFDLAVSELYFSDAILEFASNSNCPKQRFFLSCAYLLVGDAVRTGFHTSSQIEIQKFLDQAEETKNEYLLNLVARSKTLVNNPSSFDYKKWCSGGFAYEELNSYQR